MHRPRGPRCRPTRATGCTATGRGRRCSWRTTRRRACGRAAPQRPSPGRRRSRARAPRCTGAALQALDGYSPGHTVNVYLFWGDIHAWLTCPEGQLPEADLAATQHPPGRYPGGLYALYPAKLPAGGGALELEAGAVLSNSLLRRYRVRYDASRRVQAVTLEEFRSPAQPGSR